MSSDIWTLCGGNRLVRKRSLEVYRVVQGQAVNGLAKFVKNASELEILEEMLENSKPPVPEEDKSDEKLIYTPFRYFLKDKGARFNGPNSPRVWYGSRDLNTCLREKAYHQFCFIEDSVGLKDKSIDIIFTSFLSQWKSKRCVNLCSNSFKYHHDKITSPSSYFESQKLGEDMYNDSIEIFLFPSCRNPGKENFGSFTPTAYVKNSLSKRRGWTAIFRPELVTIIPHNRKFQGKAFDIQKSDFSVNGRFPRV